MAGMSPGDANPLPFGDWQFYYDRDGQPIDATTWLTLFGQGLAYARVARTTITSAADPNVTFDVSTVWLGVDHDFFGHGSPPIIFETMVFGDDSDDRTMTRYATEEQARKGHQDMVTIVVATMDDPVVMDATDVSERDG